MSILQYLLVLKSVLDGGNGVDRYLPTNSFFWLASRIWWESKNCRSHSRMEGLNVAVGVNSRRSCRISVRRLAIFSLMVLSEAATGMLREM
jgi:hypothetical protein